MRSTLSQVRKTGLLSHYYTKMMISPRQARDKHRENSKQTRFATSQRYALGVCVCVWLVSTRLLRLTTQQQQQQQDNARHSRLDFCAPRQSEMAPT
jgi:hypothetical protein